MELWEGMEWTAVVKSEVSTAIKKIFKEGYVLNLPFTETTCILLAKAMFQIIITILEGFLIQPVITWT